MDEPRVGARRRATPLLAFWLIGVVTFGGAALGLITNRHEASPTAPRADTTGNPAGFDEAARLLRAGRMAEAYGRFVALADGGDVDAARMALVMHRFGPSVFGSQWDASKEQLASWTVWSQAAENKDMAHLMQWPVHSASAPREP